MKPIPVLMQLETDADMDRILAEMQFIGIRRTGSDPVLGIISCTVGDPSVISRLRRMDGILSAEREMATPLAVS